MNSITRTATLALLIAALAGGCNFKNKQRIAAHQRWDQTRARVMCSVGTQHLKVGDLAKAEDSASKALALDPDCGPALVLLGKVLLEKGRYLQAEKHLREAELGSPDNAEVPYLLVVALEKRGRYTEALKCYQKARALAPANDAYVLASAEVLVAAGKPKLALELLTARLERTDGEAPMLALAGEVALLVDQPGRAGEFFRRCLDVAPEALGAREGLAKSSFFARQYAQALAALKELSADEDYKEKVSWVYIMSGHCQMALNRPRQAWESYRVASQIDPAEANIWTCLAKAGLAAGDARAAEQAAADSVEVDDAADMRCIGKEGIEAVDEACCQRVRIFHALGPDALRLVGKDPGFHRFGDGWRRGAAVGRFELDAIVAGWVVTGSDHHAAVGLVVDNGVAHHGRGRVGLR
ncbi:hypothetical protein LCGC14_1848150 [marine sediment metagenome]|uniref:Uncharacterized protein n=1 Tax=marine sediment metagenome TaxID=412755 RepID=A0A0F9JAE1_9ZZZZ